jgi:hypothetical protein
MKVYVVAIIDMEPYSDYSKQEIYATEELAIEAIAKPNWTDADGYTFGYIQSVTTVDVRTRVEK